MNFRSVDNFIHNEPQFELKINKIQETPYNLVDQSDTEDISDLISLPSITLTNDELQKWSNRKHNSSNIEHTNNLTSTIQTNAVIGGGLSRSDTMTTTFTFGGDDDDELIFVNQDDDDELDEEIVRRNLSFCRNEYPKEFKPRPSPGRNKFKTVRQPRLIMQEEHIEETTKTCKK